MKQDNPPRGILPRRNLCAACIASFASPWYRAAKRQAESPPEETQNTPPDGRYHRTSRYYSTFVTVLQDFFRHTLENSMILHKNTPCNLCISMKIHRDFWHGATSICNFLKKQHVFCHRFFPPAFRASARFFNILSQNRRINDTDHEFHLPSDFWKKYRKIRPASNHISRNPSHFFEIFSEIGYCNNLENPV